MIRDDAPAARAPSPARERRWPVGFGPASWVILLAVPAAWLVVLVQPRAGPALLSTDAVRRSTSFLRRLTGVGLEGPPAFRRPDIWWDVAAQAAGTLALSLCAAAVAGSLALVTAHLAARDRSGTPRLRNLVGAAVRLCYVFTRSIPEIVWALAAVLILHPGPIAAAAALAVHNAGVLGRLLTDVVEDLDPRVDAALRTAGAGPLQRYTYGILPRIVPQCLTFGLYRWEVIIRTTIVVEAVTGTGLGASLRLALSGRAFTTVTVVLVTYVAMVLLVDHLSDGLRRLAR